LFAPRTTVNIIRWILTNKNHFKKNLKSMTKEKIVVLGDLDVGKSTFLKWVSEEFPQKDSKVCKKINKFLRVMKSWSFTNLKISHLS
jgi:ABC-type phosphate/phosphonate transport system ATPase subunit